MQTLSPDRSDLGGKSRDFEFGERGMHRDKLLGVVGGIPHAMLLKMRWRNRDISIEYNTDDSIEYNTDNV